MMRAESKTEASLHNDVVHVQKWFDQKYFKYFNRKQLTTFSEFLTQDIAISVEFADGKTLPRDAEFIFSPHMP